MRASRDRNTPRSTSATAAASPVCARRPDRSATATITRCARVSSRRWNASCWTGVGSGPTPRHAWPSSSSSRDGTIPAGGTRPSAICHLSTTKGASYPPLAQIHNRPRNRGNSTKAKWASAQGNSPNGLRPEWKPGPERIGSVLLVPTPPLSGVSVLSRKPASSVRASRKNLHLGFRRPTETGPRSPAVLFAFVLVLTNPDLTQAAPTDEHILTLTPTSMGAPAFGFPSLPTGPFIGSLFLDPLDLTSSRTAESLNHPSLFALTIGNFSWTEADIVSTTSSQTPTATSRPSSCFRMTLPLFIGSSPLDPYSTSSTTSSRISSVLHPWIHIRRHGFHPGTLLLN